MSRVDAFQNLYEDCRQRLDAWLEKARDDALPASPTGAPSSARAKALSPLTHVAPRSSPASIVPQLRTVDEQVARVCDVILNNPQWQKADHVYEHLKPTNVNELATQARPVVEARAAQETAFKEWRANPTDATTQRAFAAEDRAQRYYEAARAWSEHEALRQNTLIFRRREEALAERDTLEEPLRAAVLERHRLQEFVRTGRAPAHLAACRGDDQLAYVGRHTLGPFEYLRFATANGHHVVADATRVRNALLEHRDLAVGDILLYSEARRPQSEPTRARLALAQRGPNWPLSARIEGTVGRVQRSSPPAATLRGFELTDSSGTTKWVRPERGPDLARELLPARTTCSLATGDRVALREGQLHVLGRARVAGRYR
jgi:hypothetical protein